MINSVFNRRLVSCLGFILLETLIITSRAIATSESNLAARLVAKTGKVELKREGRTKFSAIDVNTKMYIGDQIRPQKGSRAKLLCPNQKNPVSVRTGVASGLRTLCPKWPIVIHRAPIDELLGGGDSNIPYLIAPRRTLLLTDKPMFRWNTPVGTKSYQVSLLSASKPLWSINVSKSPITYSGKTILQPKFRYSVEVIAQSGQSSKLDNSSEHSFIILHPRERATIQSNVNGIMQLQVSELIKILSLADYYTNYYLPAESRSDYKSVNKDLADEDLETYNLAQEGITILEWWIQKGNNSSPLVYQTLGNAYTRAGLISLAERSYLKTIQLSQRVEDLEEKAISYYALGKLAARRENFQQALTWFLEAKQGYQQLGDQEHVQDIQYLITELQYAISE
jgi:hypothetical protein